MASPKQILSQTADTVKNLTTAQKLVAATLLIAVMGGLLYLSLMEPQRNYAVLYSGLGQKDAAAVVDELKSQGISYKLAEQGTAVMVPQGEVHETRLNLAGQGLPRGGSVGFEVFDKSNLGATDFVQNVNYQRAMQGELARTIKEFGAVQDARVHIARPKQSVFVEESEPVSASVSLGMNNSAGLSEQEIKSVVNLVAGAVPRLSGEDVTVVDTTGRLLYPKDGIDSQSAMAASKLKYTHEMERNLRHKLESMFDEVLGRNKAVVRVNADVDFSEVDSIRESYDPEEQVARSEQISREQGASGENAQGIPGVKGELATAVQSEDGEDNGKGFSRENEVRNYEISSEVVNIKEEVGSIERVSVAVMVDGTYKEVDEEGEVVREYEPRSSEDIDWLTRMTKNAIGFSEDRGDQVEVANMQFKSIEKPEEMAPDAMEKWQTLVERAIMPVLTLVAILGFFLFVVRPFIKLLASQKEESARLAREAVEFGSEEESEEEEDIGLKPRGMTDRERIYKLAQSDPDRAADLVRRWLREGE
ncbi:MAG: flagellar basal-body MS-ring/collar protein FliF [Desulfurivibrionaceae bacterium]